MRMYCSDVCAKEGAARSRRASRKRFAARHPGYFAEATKRVYSGKWPTQTDLYFKRYPDVPQACMATGCGEARVIELHHKVERRGAPARVANTQREHVWVLCPNHHTMLHRGVATPYELGLS